ncbi:hypothetical protein FRACYDRAFT_263826 [Fragilariopsis cylindrus CCMP1102]|uniref:Uncharacterized protein n=1 Tax=Fragilariopsis cylindrus CCMP1102 TaxID=635003 RepID=A0A1E7EXV4_9STRA|nr:hypothetical protein FRACYDRAFT_263826 [Fragilariopsis cylindrus CCMP1102]|eukprot:OEU10635.1 hypothetical protein FRACYDRAFT_263826 [Fragilariopsis cylindrus CCMP1102]
MSVNADDTQQNSIYNKNSKRRQRRVYQYYQLGAPTLVCEGNRIDDYSHFRTSSKNLPTDKARDIYEACKSQNRVRARWQYSIDVDKIESVTVPNLTYGRKNNRNNNNNNNRTTAATAKSKSKISMDDTEQDTEDNNNDRKSNSSGKSIIEGDYDEEEKERLHYKRWIDEEQERDRLVMLLENDSRVSRHRECIKNYLSYEHPYVDAKIQHRNSKKRHHASNNKAKSYCQLKSVIYSKSQEFSNNYQINSDPSYLAPFDLDSIKEASNYNSNGTTNFRKNIQSDLPERPSQGNSLLSIPCPCRPCSNNRSNNGSKQGGYVLLHPKGFCLERLCVSNLIPPTGEDNDGDIKNVNLNKIRNNSEFRWNIIASQPNEICLDDTILEIRQCGTWNVDNPQCVFTARTNTHVSVVSIICKRPVFDGQQHQQQYSSESTTCWGCYVLEEIERLDHRSFFPKIPSFRPVSLASHPRYGNALAPSKFAFVSHSVGDSASTFNVIHSCSGGTGGIVTKRHDINNLKSISLIDFNSTNPMCLWSVASSYIRPALVPGAISKMLGQTKSPFGLGSSLYTIDLRSNSATFQWSPSAEEMTTEGVHSISGILTDWTRDHIVWATSTSAGKTWEIDARMPCQTLNTWSLTAVCEASRNFTIPRKGLHGENSILYKPPLHCNDRYNEISSLDDSPLIKVDTDFNASGIHLFQKPLHRPRFQTDSLECIAAPGIQCTDKTSIATSSFFDLTDVSDDVYTCGISSIGFPINSFVDANENIWQDYLEHKLNILCTLTMNNNGDIHSHSLLECDDKKSKIDDSVEVTQIRKMNRASAGLMISEVDRPHEMINDDRSLIMPVLCSSKIERIKVYGGRDDRSDDNDGVLNENLNSTRKNTSLERTDLSNNVIQSMLKEWDITSESESESEQHD